jgi:hypothetical protein
MQIIILFIVVMILNISFYKKIKAFSHTIYCAALISIISTVIFQVLAYIFIGYLDPFFILAMSIQIVISFLIGFIINFAIYYILVHKKR